MHLSVNTNLSLTYSKLFM